MNEWVQEGDNSKSNIAIPLPQKNIQVASFLDHDIRWKFYEHVGHVYDWASLL